MLEVLDQARRDKNVSLVDMADLIGVRSQTVSDKINGLYDFKFGEALEIQKEFFPEYDLAYLFSAKNEEAKKSRA